MDTDTAPNEEALDLECNWSDAMYILCWNRDHPANFPLELWEEGRRACLEGDVFVTTWTVGNHRNIIKGSSCVLLIQGTKHPRGLAAFGEIIKEPFEDKHYDDPTRKTNYVEVAWLEMLDLDEVVPVAEVQTVAPNQPWLQGIRGSGHAVDPEHIQDVMSLFGDYSPWHQESGPGEIPPGSYTEGAVTSVRVNRYERDRRAREACLANHGHICQACDTDLTKIYGQELGERAIHVHHIVPISQMQGKSYDLDPVKDLVPLCPNCHNVIHKIDPIPSVKSFRKILKNSQ